MQRSSLSIGLIGVDLVIGLDTYNDIFVINSLKKVNVNLFCKNKNSQSNKSVVGR